MCIRDSSMPMSSSMLLTRSTAWVVVVSVNFFHFTIYLLLSVDSLSCKMGRGAYRPLSTFTNNAISTTSTTGRTILCPSWTTRPEPM